MKSCRKIDKSLTERHNIINLLESLKREDITLEEMERIGVKLQKAGKRALSPLIRRLWREENSDHISRYVFLLDFFEDDVWIDHIIRIALKRSDLEEDGRAALLAVLEDYGIDLSAPPFSRVLAEINGPLESVLPKLLDRGVEGLIRFMEDFLCYPEETQVVLIGYLARIRDLRVLGLLEILLGFDDGKIVRETIVTLGKIRDGRAAALLSAFDCRGETDLRQLAERSLRRLSFLGVVPDILPMDSHARSTYASAVSSIDGSGNRTLWFSRSDIDGLQDVLIMQIHETRGMVDALGYSDISQEKYEKLLQEVTSDEALTEIDHNYAVLLIRDALHLNRKNCSYLPAEFYVRRRILPADALVPHPYTPDFAGYDLHKLAASHKLAEQSTTLFEEEYFDGWFTADSRLFDLAEEYDLLDNKSTEQSLVKSVENFIERFIQDKVANDSERMARRLFLIADLMVKTGREKNLVEKTLAVASNLLYPHYPRQGNPFLRQFALESLKITREAVAEGFDFRLHREWDEDEELWD
ncbi:MAG TPA: HEAT repeat domain-containing protein [Geobacteraceae bacterium]|nr:HEAT repeat domain-containing protein [Geobacteraceae bacterium]